MSSSIDVSALKSALQQLSPVMTNVADSVRRRLLRRYLDASSRNVPLHLMALALLLFGFAYAAPIEWLLGSFGLVSAVILLRGRLAQPVTDGLRQGLIRSTLAHDACLLAISVFWGAAPFLITALVPDVDFYATVFVAGLAAGLNSMSYLSALPASVVYVVASMGMLALTCAMRGTVTGWVLAAATGMFATAIVSRLSVNHQMMLRMLVAERKNISLIERLQAYHEHLEEENETLGASLKDVSESAMRDPLTGAFNRHYLTAMAPLLTEHVRRRGEAITICMVDVDHFKRINDRFGHAFGDEVLKGVVQQLSGRLRDNDTLARFGGEEFVVFLRNCEIERAQRVAEALRHNVSLLQFNALGGLQKVTASIGLARWQRHETLDQVLQRADRAMYQAKEAGRDRIAVDNEEVQRVNDAEDTDWQGPETPF